MAIDGTQEDLADTSDNVAVFGRHRSGRGESAFPQMRGVYLAECGTHAIVDAGFWPLSTGERTGGFRMLRSLTDGMLVMWDRGFHDYDMIDKARQQGAHVLGRLPAHVKPKPILILPDGSHLAYLYPSLMRLTPTSASHRARSVAKNRSPSSRKPMASSLPTLSFAS